MADWFVSKGGKTHGPFSSAQLKQLAAASKIDTSTQVRMGADGQWVTADRVKGLFVAAMATAATPSPVQPPPRPQAKPVPAPVQAIPAMNDSSDGEREVLKVHPSMFRGDPLLFIAGSIIVPTTIALPLFRSNEHSTGVDDMALRLWFLVTLYIVFAFFVWWLRCLKTSLTVTNKRTTMCYGLLSRYTKEVRHCDVRILIVSQGFLQRLLGVGALAVASAATGESDIKVNGLPHPEKIKELIDGFRS